VTAEAVDRPFVNVTSDYRDHIERSLSWLGCWRRLQVRWDRDSGRFFAFALVACALVCFNQLEPANRSDVRLR